MGRVAQEIACGHFAAGDKRGNRGEHSESNQQAAEKLDNPGGEHQRNVPHLRPSKNTKKLLGAVAGKQEARYHTHQAVKMVRVSFQEGHALASLSLAV